MKLVNKFWNWYERNETFNVGVASLLFTLQIVHLYWLTTSVMAFKLFGKSFFNPSDFFEIIILIVDYLEIPAIATTTLLYLNELRKRANVRSLLFLFFINSQWLHILWITDEYVIEHLTNHSATTLLPVWIAWIAILIDYLELPVILDTLKKFTHSLKKEGVLPALERLKENN